VYRQWRAEPADRVVAAGAVDRWAAAGAGQGGTVVGVDAAGGHVADVGVDARPVIRADLDLGGGEFAGAYAVDLGFDLLDNRAELGGSAAMVFAQDSQALTEGEIGLAAQAEDLGPAVLGQAGQVVDVLVAAVELVRAAGVVGISEISGFIPDRSGMGRRVLAGTVGVGVRVGREER
jgi:hypothetical protein